jgi:hypothetical protein
MKAGKDGCADSAAAEDATGGETPGNFQAKGSQPDGPLEIPRMGADGIILSGARTEGHDKFLENFRVLFLLA